MKTAIFAGLLCLASTDAFSSEEIITRSAMHFADCPATISMMLESLGVDQNSVQTISDTGAHYYVELESVSANLVFRCNAVLEQLEIAKITPGTLVVVASE